MQTPKTIEVGVGLFILIALAALVFLSLKVANVTPLDRTSSYPLYATFDNVSGLKPHSPVKIGGVVVGQIERITLDPKDYRPRVQLAIAQRYNRLPETSRLVSQTSGLLGEKYLTLIPGFVDSDTAMLKAGDTIEDTQSSIVLEELIGHFLYHQHPAQANPRNSVTH